MSFATTDELLDFPLPIGQVASAFHFQLIDGVTGRLLQELHPVRDSPPSLDHDTTRTIKRSVSNLFLERDDAAAVDPIVHRVRISMELEDGSVHPKGTYMFSNDTLARRSSGSPITASLFDLGFLLDRAIETTFSVFAGINIGDAMRTLAFQAGFTDVFIDATPAVAGAPMTWAAGTSGAKIMDDLALAGHYFPVFVDNRDRLRGRFFFDPALAHADLDLDASSRILFESIAETNDLLSAPDRFIVVDSSNTNDPVVGQYDIPSTAPHSAFRRGFSIPAPSSVQGLHNQQQADDTAKGVGLFTTVYEHVELHTTLDPRHDGHDVIRYRGVNWLETAWSMPLTPEGAMKHQMRRAYQIV